jgi:hypothetical protein
VQKCWRACSVGNSYSSSLERFSWTRKAPAGISPSQTLRSSSSSSSSRRSSIILMSYAVFITVCSPSSSHQQSYGNSITHRAPAPRVVCQPPVEGGQSLLEPNPSQNIRLTALVLHSRACADDSMAMGHDSSPGRAHDRAAPTAPSPTAPPPARSPRHATTPLGPHAKTRPARISPFITHCLSMQHQVIHTSPSPP